MVPIKPLTSSGELCPLALALTIYEDKLFLHHSWKVTQTSSAVSISWGTESQPTPSHCSLSRPAASPPPCFSPWLWICFSDALDILFPSVPVLQSLLQSSPTLLLQHCSRCSSVMGTATHDRDRPLEGGSYPKLHAGNLFYQRELHLHRELGYRHTHGSLPALESPNRTSAKSTLSASRAEKGRGQVCKGSTTAPGTPAAAGQCGCHCLHLSVEKECWVPCQGKMCLTRASPPPSPGTLQAGTSQGHPKTCDCSDTRNVS